MQIFLHYFCYILTIYVHLNYVSPSKDRDLYTPSNRNHFKLRKPITDASTEGSSKAMGSYSKQSRKFDKNTHENHKLSQDWKEDMVSSGVTGVTEVATAVPAVTGEKRLPIFSLLNSSFVHKMNSFRTLKEFALAIGLASPHVASIANVSFDTASADPSTSAPDATPTGCIPLLTSVPTFLPDDPAITFFYPRCILLERCQGCCYSDLHECQPIEQENVTLSIIRAISSSQPSDRRRVSQSTDSTDSTDSTESYERIAINVMRHTRCGCECKRKETDCGLNQEFNDQDCSCSCEDSKTKQDCLEKEKKFTHKWDPRDCFCHCLEQKACSSGFVLDNNSCSCIYESAFSLASSRSEVSLEKEVDFHHSQRPLYR